MSEKTVLQGRQSSQFYIDDDRPETCPRYNIRGIKVTNLFTYHMMQVLGALCHDLGEHEFGPDSVVTITLKTIDDGTCIVYMVKGRLEVEVRECSLPDP